MQVSPTKKTPFPSYHHSFFGPFFLAARLARAPPRSCRRRSSPSLSGADGPPPVVCFKPLPSMRRRDPSSPGNWKSPNDRAKERPFREGRNKEIVLAFSARSLGNCKFSFLALPTPCGEGWRWKRQRKLISSRQSDDLWR